MNQVLKDKLGVLKAKAERKRAGHAWRWAQPVQRLELASEHGCSEDSRDEAAEMRRRVCKGILTAP